MDMGERNNEDAANLMAVVKWIQAPDVIKDTATKLSHKDEF